MDADWRRLRIGVIASDVLAIFLAYTLAAGGRFGFDSGRLGDLWPVYPVLAACVALLAIGVGWQYGTYGRSALTGTVYVFPRLITVATYGVVIVMIMSYLVGGQPIVSRGWLLGSWLGSIVLLAASRTSWRLIAARWRRRGMLRRKLLIAGANRQGIAVAQQLHDPVRHGTMVLGFLDDYQRPGTEVLPGIAVVGHPQDVLEQAQLLGADEVITIAGALTWESQQKVAEILTRPDAPIEARISPTYYDLLTTSAELTHIAYVPMLTLHRTRLSGMAAVAKGAMDRAIAASLLLAFAPAFLYWRIKASVLGVPMLVREPARGAGGRPLSVLGLNRRLTSSAMLGRLPAFWNVLRNELSLVGPRPIHYREVRDHEKWLTNLFAMRPGVTGLWRLQSRELAFEQRVALDLYYVRNYSLVMDIQILLATLREVLRRVLGRSDELARWRGPGPQEPAIDTFPLEREAEEQEAITGIQEAGR